MYHTFRVKNCPSTTHQVHAGIEFRVESCGTLTIVKLWRESVFRRKNSQRGSKRSKIVELSKNWRLAGIFLFVQIALTVYRPISFLIVHADRSEFLKTWFVGQSLILFEERIIITFPCSRAVRVEIPFGVRVRSKSWSSYRQLVRESV